jgi:hypothetical protein
MGIYLLFKKKKIFLLKKGKECLIKLSYEFPMWEKKQIYQMHRVGGNKKKE